MKHHELLLSYTYFLNNESTKFICIGYDTIHFSPIIHLNHIRKSSIIWNILDWLTFTTHICSIQDFLSHNSNNINISFTNFLISNCDEKIFIKDKVSLEEVEITAAEMFTLINLIDFLNTIMFHYKSCVAYIQEYYNLYVLNCSTKNVFSLSTSDYFVPPSDRFQLNYYRLFYEIPIIFKEKLLFDVMNKMILCNSSDEYVNNNNNKIIFNE